MKKIIALVLVTVMLLCMVSCGYETETINTQTADDNDSAMVQTADNNDSAEVQTYSDDGFKALVMQAVNNREPLLEQTYNGSYTEYSDRAKAALENLMTSVFEAGFYVASTSISFKDNVLTSDLSLELSYKNDDVSVNTDDAVPFTPESYREFLLETVKNDVEKASCLVISDGFDLSVCDETRTDFFNSSSYSLYKVDSASSEVFSYDDYTYISISVEYKEGTVPVHDSTDEDPVETVEYFTENAETWTETMAVHSEDENITSEYMMMLYDCAILNDPERIIVMPDKVNGVAYSSQGSDLITELKAEMPADYEQTMSEYASRYEAELDNIVAELTPVISELSDDDKYKKICQAVCDRAYYDQELADAILNNGSVSDMSVRRTAVGAVLGLGTICTGYSMAFKAICDRFDLPCWVIAGTSDGTGHAWCAIRLNGETRYMDPTFIDEQGYGEYFLFKDYDTLSDTRKDEDGWPYPW